MKLTFKEFNGRGVRCSTVFDEDTGKEVGYVGSHGVGRYRSGGLEVSLFGGKYRGWLHSLPQCRAFILGVEAVLDHMTETGAQCDRLAEKPAA